MAYYYLIGLTITDQQVLLSTEVNELPLLEWVSYNIILWHYNYTDTIGRDALKSTKAIGTNGIL